MSQDATTPVEDVDLIERFIAAFNAIDQHLQRILGEDGKSSFRNLVDVYAHQHKWWRDGERLRTYTQLRNVLVHEKTAPYTYVCVPTVATVADLEAIRDRFIHPTKVIPMFARNVVVIAPQDSLDIALSLIN
ncbi:MAG: hypothetical protein JOZ57_00345, partial [Abitibacteriaceae bacterium]|nr:hypothetical protein [Abditibacteriaceae bacterium]